jgi:nucleotide-binding universal stress UspA family protein
MEASSEEVAMNAFPPRMLLATDGSAEAERAARMAVRLSTRLGSELHVVYVEPVPEAYINQWSVAEPEFVDDARGRAEDEAREKAGQEAARIKEAGGEVARAHGRVGRPDAEIVRLAEEIGAGLTVVGSRGLGALKRVLLGSVSTGVVRHAHGSVLVVRGDDHPPGRILLALDGSEEAGAASRVAAEIADKTGSELSVLVALPLVAPHPYPLARDAWEEAKEQARIFIDEEAERLRAETNTTVEAHLALGNPDEEIVRAGEELGAGMIVVGSRGLGGVQRALMGSVSNSVVRHAHCPVLVVREA